MTKGEDSDPVMEYVKSVRNYLKPVYFRIYSLHEMTE